MVTVQRYVKFWIIDVFLLIFFCFADKMCVLMCDFDARCIAQYGCGTREYLMTRCVSLCE